MRMMLGFRAAASAASAIGAANASTAISFNGMRFMIWGFRCEAMLRSTTDVLSRIIRFITPEQLNPATTNKGTRIPHHSFRPLIRCTSGSIDD